MGAGQAPKDHSQIPPQVRVAQLLFFCSVQGNAVIRKFEFSFTLPDEREVYIQAEMEAPDRGVGLLEWAGSVTATDLDGNPIELTPHESDLAHWQAVQMCSEPDYD
jgi:hypothetical protein